MSNLIAQGTSGQASFVSANTTSATGSPNSSTMAVFYQLASNPPVLVSGMGTGWNMTKEGIVTVPPGAGTAPGDDSTFYEAYVIEIVDEVRTQYIYRFGVSCIVVDLAQGDAVPFDATGYSITFTATPSGGAIPYSNSFEISAPGEVGVSTSTNGLSITFLVPYSSTGSIEVTANLTDSSGCAATATATATLTPMTPPDPDCDLSVSASYVATSETTALITAVGNSSIEGAINFSFYDTTAGGFLDLIETNTAQITIPPGQSHDVFVGALDTNGCVANTTLTVLNPSDGGDDPCSLSLTLSYERVTPGQYRVSGTTAATSIAWSFGTGGVIPNETAKSCLVSVAPGVTTEVRGVVMQGACSNFASISVDGDSIGGGDASTLDVSLSMIDQGGGYYLVTANITGNKTSGVSIIWQVNGAVVEPYNGMANQQRVLVPFGTTSTVVAAVIDGTDTAAESLPITNSDGTGVIIPEPPITDDNCVSRIGYYQRDFRADSARADAVIHHARFGIESRSLCGNPACNYWVQLLHSSDEALFGVYTDEALAAHFPLTLEVGESQTAFENRFERHQYLTGANMRPATIHVHLREVWTPVFELWNLSTGTDVVTKIRDISDTSSLVFGINPAKVFRYDVAPASAIGPDRAGTLTLLSNLGALSPSASNATDVCIVADKIYVIAPSSPTGIIVIDTDAGESVLNSGVYGETRAPKFIENVAGKAIAVYVDAAQTPATKAYDISFQPPRALWTLPAAVTKVEVGNGKLLVAAGTALCVSNGGTSAPVLDNDFGVAITALAPDYVGLANGHVWRKLSTGWAEVTTLVGSVGALWPWYGGAEELRALAGASTGADANILRSEQAITGAWFADRALTGSTGEAAMRALTREIAAQTETNPAIVDERMLIGDTEGKLWIYSKSRLSEADGAFKTCHTTNQRVIPQFRAKLATDG